MRSNSGLIALTVGGGRTIKWRRAQLRCTALLLSICGAAVCGAVDDERGAASPRIVSLAPHLTELAFAAGAGERIVGTVEYSDFPPAARRIARIGDAFRIDFERVLALQPDVVLVWESGTAAATIERLRSLGLPVRVIGTRRLADIAAALREIGELTGAAQSAGQAAAQYEADMAALRAQYRDRAQLSVFVQVNDRPLYTVNGRQIMSEVIELCGGRNIFASLSELAPIVSIESVIAANPQVILTTDEALPDARAYWRRWRRIEAVRRGAVYTISADRLARPTPRLVEGAREVCRMLDEARLGAGGWGLEEESLHLRTG